MVCFVVLFVQLNRLTVFQAAELNDNPNNTRDILRDFSQPRGSITTADGVVIARSVPSGDRFEYQREYPEGPLFAHITGFFSFTLGSSGVEKTYNDELAGRTLELSFQDLGDLFVDKDRVGDLTLTRARRPAAHRHRAARRAGGLGRGPRPAHRRDPHDGVVPVLRPEPAGQPRHRGGGRRACGSSTRARRSPGSPAPTRSASSRAPPSRSSRARPASSTAASRPTSPCTRVTSSYTPPGTTRPIRNFGGSSCGGALFQILRVSCNTAFAQMGVDTGPDPMIEVSEDFGFNQEVPIDLTDPARSNFPTDFEQNLPALAQSPIGQNDVAATPLQMAMVAAAVANGGEVMAPHVLRDVRDPDGNVVDTYDPEVWTTAMDEPTADLMGEAMRGVVDSGTATRLDVPGFDVGGKTGTAQLGHRAGPVARVGHRLRRAPRARRPPSRSR